MRSLTLSALLAVACASPALMSVAAQTTGAYPLPPPHPPEQQRTEAEARRVADRARGVAVGDDAVDDRPIELVQVAELFEVGGDLGVAHRASEGTHDQGRFPAQRYTL